MCDAALASPVTEIVVILGHLANEIARAVPPADRIRVAINDRYAEGQSTSLRAGLRALHPQAEAAVVLLGDQPGVRPEAIAAVVGAWREEGTPVVQASYAGRPAHPTLFDRTVWPELDAATGDEGARGAIHRHPQWRRLVEVEGPPPRDIDTEEDYERVRADFAARRLGSLEGPPG